MRIELIVVDRKSQSSHVSWKRGNLSKCIPRHKKGTSEFALILTMVGHMTGSLSVIGFWLRSISRCLAELVYPTWRVCTLCTLYQIDINLTSKSPRRRRRLPYIPTTSIIHCASGQLLSYQISCSCLSPIPCEWLRYLCVGRLTTACGPGVEHAICSPLPDPFLCRSICYSQLSGTMRFSKMEHFFHFDPFWNIHCDALE